MTRRRSHVGKIAVLKDDELPESYPTLQLDRHGWLRPHPCVTLTASPNCDARPQGVTPSLLVVHNISLPPGVFGGPYVTDLFLNRLHLDAHPWFKQLNGLKVSAHFFVRRDGSIVQFVSTDQRAWHAGVSRFNGRERCNDYSVGIELEGTDTLAYTAAQYLALSHLSVTLQARYPLLAVRGHEHIAPGRKTDPGTAFDWARFGREARWFRRQLPQ